MTEELELARRSPVLADHGTSVQRGPVIVQMVNDTIRELVGQLEGVGCHLPRYYRERLENQVDQCFLPLGVGGRC